MTTENDKRTADTEILDALLAQAEQDQADCIFCKDENEPCSHCMNAARLVGSIKGMRERAKAQGSELPEGWVVENMEGMEWQAYGPGYTIMVPKRGIARHEVCHLVWAIHNLKARVCRHDLKGDGGTDDLRTWKWWPEKCTLCDHEGEPPNPPGVWWDHDGLCSNCGKNHLEVIQSKLNIYDAALKPTLGEWTDVLKQAVDEFDSESWRREFGEQWLRRARKILGGSPDEKSGSND